MNSTKIIHFALFLVPIFIFRPQSCLANNLSVSNVTLEQRNPSAETVVVEFDVSWENSWKTKINHDAAWVTVRLYDPTSTPANKKLCQLTEGGLNPSGTSVGTSSDIELYVPNDLSGVIIRPNRFAKFDSISSNNVRLTIDYNSCGFSSSDAAVADIFAIEMVFVPEGAFYAGDHGTSVASLVEGSADTDSWYISSESPISVSNTASNGYYYVSNGNVGENSTGSSFTLSEDFPKGYGAFYTMKYEITEEQWTVFVNSLPEEARLNRDITDSSHKNTDSVSSRNTVSCSGTPLSCETDRPARPVSFLTWMDLAAFLDWAALRPMTELEFEKMARGPLLSVDGEYAWGTENITAAETLSSGDELGMETVTTSGANAQFNNVTLSGGDSVYGEQYAKGPLRTGIFATNSSDREMAGAGYYGVLDLSGNLAERAVTIGHGVGRDFTGSHGDGNLSTASGYEGNANQPDWPGIDDVAGRGVTGSLGSGFKGGSWAETSNRLRTSDRNDAANGTAGAFSAAGGRGVRTYDGD